MADLSSSRRSKLPKSDFALPKNRAYPIENIAHARDALSRIAQFGSGAQQKEVRAKVDRKYPGLDK